MGYEISSLPVLFATPPPEYAYKKPLCRPERKQNPNAGGGGRRILGQCSQAMIIGIK